ncbi:PREDICTED: uncharacterized protein LOC104803600 isoform X2 [Tarenaya hassleriana]|uniref:uncharacterized protein LOC104803600 isoform X2 n=1 Tax=Tarenaya hassleriana TaxID=28532 RepID=UPI00053C7409|nr:PREDICTED: uncharacterized protein LOC104803600 isoform X2 [Tarenaya hassleriana]
MDRCLGKRAIEGRPEPKKGGGSIVLRDRFNSPAPICGRVGCSAGNPPGKCSTWIGSSDRKEKSMLSSSFRSSSNGKEIIGASSKPGRSLSSSTRNEKKPVMSQTAMDSSESSASSEEEGDAQILDDSLVKNKKRVHEKFKSTEAECSNLRSSSRIRRGFRPRFGLNNQDFCPGPSSQAASANTISRHGLRNRSCRPMLSSGVIPSGFGLEKTPNHRVDKINTRKSFGESSSTSSPSSRGKNTNDPPSEEKCDGSNLRISVSDNRRARNFISNRNDDANSVGTQRSANACDYRARSSTRECGRNGLSSITIPEMSHPETSNHLDSLVSLELFRGFPDVGLPVSLTGQDTFHAYNLDGISENSLQILPELNRIEQDIELNYEDLLVMETGLLLGGLSFYDRHRDMRLDIDNMSYEELLALEERIGSVSTPLSEEAISKCMKTGIYLITSLNDKPNISSCGYKDEAKCSICQEEYTVGDEVGKLQCEHMYHVGCVKEWLRLKNWCPVCRASAEPSSPQLPLSSSSSS